PSARGELRADGYRRLVEVAAGARYPRRPSLTYLAPLYTWLQFSRRRVSRLRLLTTLYGNYFRFRRARGPLAAVITGSGPFALEAALAVRFDAAGPVVDAVLR